MSEFHPKNIKKLHLHVTLSRIWFSDLDKSGQWVVIDFLY